MFLKSVLKKSVQTSNPKSQDFSIVQKIAAHELNYINNKQKPLLYKDFKVGRERNFVAVHTEKNVGVLPK